MDVTVRDALSLRTVCLEVDPYCTVANVTLEAADALGYHVQDVRLSLEGEDLDDVLVADTPMHAGCCIDLQRCTREYVQGLQDRSLRLADSPEWVQGDRECILAAVQGQRFSFRHASEELRADKTFVLEAVRTEGTALAHAAPALRADKECVLAAAQQNGFSLMYAAPELTHDADCALAAVASRAEAFESVGASLRNDPAFLLAVLAVRPECFSAAPVALRKNRECAVAAVSRDHRMLDHADPSLVSDGSLAAIARVAKRRGLYLKHEMPKSEL